MPVLPRWVLLGACIAVSVTAQLLMKMGVQEIRGVHLGAEPIVDTLLRIFHSRWLLMGFVAYGSGTLLWLAVLSEFPLNEAILYFSSNNLVLLAASVVLFDEKLTPQRWFGALLVIAGLILVKQVPR